MGNDEIKKWENKIQWKDLKYETNVYIYINIYIYIIYKYIIYYAYTYIYIIFNNLKHQDRLAIIIFIPV